MVDSMCKTSVRTDQTVVDLKSCSFLGKITLESLLLVEGSVLLW